MPFYSTKGIIINRYTPQKYLRSIFLKHIPKTALKVPIFALFSKGYVYCPLSTKGMKSFAMQKIKSNPPSALADRRTRPTCQIEDLELVPGTLAFATPCAARLHRLRFHPSIARISPTVRWI